MKCCELLYPWVRTAAAVRWLVGYCQGGQTLFCNFKNKSSVFSHAVLAGITVLICTEKGREQKHNSAVKEFGQIRRSLEVQTLTVQPLMCCCSGMGMSQGRRNYLSLFLDISLGTNSPEMSQMGDWAGALVHSSKSTLFLTVPTSLCFRIFIHPTAKPCLQLLCF